MGVQQLGDDGAGPALLVTPPTYTGKCITPRAGSEDSADEQQEFDMAHRRHITTPVDHVAQEAEKARRRSRTERGRSPAQLTTRSLDAYRADRYPGQRERRKQRQQLRGEVNAGPPAPRFQRGKQAVR
jgi:hypothetical protein